MDLLAPGEAARLHALAREDPDDVPSATLALVLKAFYLSNDRPALRAVYGDYTDFSDHDRWLEVLRSGSDAGQLGQAFQLTFNLASLLGSGLSAAVKNLITTAGDGSSSLSPRWQFRCCASCL